ncbi:MAG: outer-membrane lipoprotein carrier protein LolA, partial [Sedimenticolaceae bacterium]
MPPRPWLFVLCLTTSPLVAAGDGRDALDAFLDGLTTLQSRFEQAVLDTENSTSGLLRGEFLLERPGRFRWDYSAPNKQVI